MGLVVKKDDFRDEEDRDIEIIERGAGPDPEADNPVELIGRAKDPAADAEAAHQAMLEQEAQLNRATSERLARERAAAEGEDAAAEKDAHTGAHFSTGADDRDVQGSADEGMAMSEEKSPARAGGSGNGGGNVKLPIAIAAVVIAAIVFAIGGYLLGSGGFGGKGTGTAALSESQLDDVVATYTYNGAHHDVTARQAIETQYSVDNVKNDDGTYAAPSADTVLGYVRTQILLDDAASRGIEVSDDDMASYAERALGSSDYDALAEQYGVTTDQAKQIVRDNCTQQKLYEQVVPDGASATAPEAPEEPADGNNETVDKKYADYIINLAGDEWDSETGTWASEDGPYYQALSGEEWNADGATYTQAQTAYYVAYQQYASQASEGQTAWADYINGLYANANVEVYGLYI